MKSFLPLLLFLFSVSIFQVKSQDIPGSYLVVAIDGGFPNHLFVVSPASPLPPISSVLLSGLQKGEQLLAIAQQRTSGTVWGISNANRLYQVDPYTGKVYYRSGLSCDLIYDNPTLHASFDSITGLLHVVTLLTEQNVNHVTIDVSSGECLSLDLIKYPEGQVSPIYPAGAAFNPVDNTFFLVNSLPNNQFGFVDLRRGEFRAVGALGVEVSGVGGFDIIPEIQQYGFAALYTPSSLRSDIYSIDLSNGKASLLLEIDGSINLLSFAAVSTASLTPDRQYSSNPIPPSGGAANSNGVSPTGTNGGSRSNTKGTNGESSPNTRATSTATGSSSGASSSHANGGATSGGSNANSNSNGGSQSDSNGRSPSNSNDSQATNGYGSNGDNGSVTNNVESENGTNVKDRKTKSSASNLSFGSFFLLLLLFFSL